MYNEFFKLTFSLTSGPDFFFVPIWYLNIIYSSKGFEGMDRRGEFFVKLSDVHEKKSYAKVLWFRYGAGEGYVHSLHDSSNTGTCCLPVCFIISDFSTLQQSFVCFKPGMAKFCTLCSLDIVPGGGSIFCWINWSVHWWLGSVMKKEKEVVVIVEVRKRSGSSRSQWPPTNKKFPINLSSMSKVVQEQGNLYTPLTVAFFASHIWLCFCGTVDPKEQCVEQMRNLHKSLLHQRSQELLCC